MKANADYWLEGDYLRYIGWVLSDEVSQFHLYIVNSD